MDKLVTSCDVIADDFNSRLGKQDVSQRLSITGLKAPLIISQNIHANKDLNFLKEVFLYLHSGAIQFGDSYLLRFMNENL